MEVRSIETIVKALNDARVQYLIVGGLAANELATVVGYAALVELKKSAGRLQDLADIEKLRKLEDRRKKS